MTTTDKQANTNEMARGADRSTVQGADLRDEPQATALHEGLDYYVEHGLFVFTAAFLRKRGYCCDSGCRHCPYQNRQQCRPPAS